MEGMGSHNARGVGGSGRTPALISWSMTMYHEASAMRHMTLPTSVSSLRYSFTVLKSDSIAALTDSALPL